MRPLNDGFRSKEKSINSESIDLDHNQRTGKSRPGSILPEILSLHGPDHPPEWQLELKYYWTFPANGG